MLTLDSPHIEYLVKEANLAFALNTHLFALINPPSATAASSSSLVINSDGKVNSSSSAAVINKPLDPSQPHKRYYELNQKNKEEQVKPKSWRELIERFALAAIAVFIGQIVAKYGIPYAREMLAK